MPEEDTLPISKLGDQLDAASMTFAASLLLKQASEVARRLGIATKQSVIDHLLRQHEQLVSDAISLNSRAISLVAGEAKVEGEAIAEKIANVSETLKKIASIKRALGVIDALLSFVAAVLTGSGTAIVAAGIKLDGDLMALGKV